MDFVAASLVKVRFLVILCPINFVGKIRDSVGDMAKEFAAQDGMEELAARASAVVILSKPVRQGVLFECLTQLHAEGVFQAATESDDMLDAMPRLKLKRQRQQDKSAADSLAAVAAGRRGDGDSPIYERRHSLRVLLVDDSSTSQQAMRRVIIDAGMLCDVAGNGKEALAAIEGNGQEALAAPGAASYHLVLMDLVMPEMDGATATRFLREAEAEQGQGRRRLPVIGISATLSNQAVCIAAGRGLHSSTFQLNLSRF